MNKEELHKAAEEWLKEKGFSDSDYMDSGMIDHIADACTYFHIHQTKKMLDGWTDQEIGFFLQSHNEAGAATEGACIFRDELLKQLEG